MNRIVWVVLAIIGFSAMTASPADAWGERRAEMLPPTSSFGANSTVNCFYHTGACPPYGGSWGGNAIDWGPSTAVWQRFRVWPEDPSYNVTTQLSANFQDGYGCDYYNLNIWSYKNGQYTYQGSVTFKHANTAYTGVYTVEYPGGIANWNDGAMTWDSNCGGGNPWRPWWNAYHVRESSSGESWLNPVYDKNNPAMCYPGGGGGTICQNNNLVNVTRAFISQ